ncbi:nuclear pore complex protein NUP98B-like isoform X4 [Rhododendron vialii]|uniref:nuclear pore complex protein NUP98B-like isoform X4 n=1 Tax=Rhododendron vialii TaxID=182163 RepID=UPI00265E443E|nr:nuclear pore complex protein NUP98B-like isoform X4 [Rhododendron vialii]
MSHLGPHQFLGRTAMQVLIHSLSSHLGVQLVLVHLQEDQYMVELQRVCCVNSSSLGQQSTYGSPLPPAFGTSTAAFDAPFAPSFGTSSSSFGPSIFGVKPPFGGFASSPNQSTSFGRAFQQAQTTFGTNPFGSSSSFGASTQNAFGSSSTSGSTPATSFASGTGGEFSAAKPLGPSSTRG